EQSGSPPRRLPEDALAVALALLPSPEAMHESLAEVLAERMGDVVLERIASLSVSHSDRSAWLQVEGTGTKPEPITSRSEGLADWIPDRPGREDNRGVWSMAALVLVMGIACGLWRESVLDDRHP